MPWWGAIVIAVLCTALGFAFDAGSGSKELTAAFAVSYTVGCLAAVLAVRQEGVFTAVVQPPLILFVAVPSAYFLFHYSDIAGIKDILINCGYPLIERFLLMFTVAVLVLLIGMARWYFGAPAKATQRDAAKPSGRVRTRTAEAAPAGRVGALVSAASGALAGLRAKFAELAASRGVSDDEDSRKHAIDRPAPSRRPGRERPTRRTAATRSRHARPPMDDPDDVDVAPRPRRRRPPADVDPAGEYRPRRRREDGDPTRRPRPDYRAEPRRRVDPYERPRRRADRYDPYEPPGRYAAPRQQDRYAAEPGPDRYEPLPPRRRHADGDTTHHPVSRVRYRGAPPEEPDQPEFRRPRRAREDHEDWR